MLWEVLSICIPSIKSKKSTDTKQSRQIASLQQQVANLRVSKKKKNNGKKPRAGGSKQYDPIHTAIRARFVPFDTEKGIASPLIDGRPSQKFMAKAQTQITLAAGQGFCFMACPNLAANPAYASVVFAVGAFTGGIFTTNGDWKSATVGDQVGAYGTLVRLSTNTPYTATTLSDAFEYSCVGAGLKFTYEGSELYRGGTLRYLYDKDGSYNVAADWTLDTVNGLITYVNSAANTVRQSLNKDNVVEINVSAPQDGYVEAGLTSTAYGPSGGASALIGGATATTYFATSPNVLGYYVNTSGNSISFHVDVVEHWSLTHPTIQSLQTPSYAHAPMATHVAALMDNVRQNHAGAPNVKHLDVTKTTLTAMKSPIGHELLNAGIRAALL